MGTLHRSVASRWARCRVVEAKVRRDLSGFREEVEGKRFRNPETGNEVLFESLPRKEQARMFAEWRRRQRGDEPRRDRERGLIEIDREKARSEAKRMAEKIQGWKVRDPDEPLGERFLPGMGGPVTLGKMLETSVKGRPRPFPVLLGVGKPVADLWRSGRHFVSGGSVAFRHLGENDDGYPLSLRINLNPKVTYRELQDPKSRDRIEREIYSVMVHEMTHARDVIETPAQQRRREKGIPEGAGTSDHPDEARRKDRERLEGREREYYNRPSEVRAFKRQVAEEVRRELEKIHKVHDFKRDRAREKGDEADDDPEWLPTDAASVMDVLGRSPTWDRMRTWLTPQNRRKVLETVASVVRKFKEDRGGKVARRVAAAWLLRASSFEERIAGRLVASAGAGEDPLEVARLRIARDWVLSSARRGTVAGS